MRVLRRSTSAAISIGRSTP